MTFTLRRTGRQLREGVQTVDQVPDHRVRLAIHRERNRAVPGKLLGYLRMHAAAGQVADERMPQGVKINHAARLGVGEKLAYTDRRVNRRLANFRFRRFTNAASADSMDGYCSRGAEHGRQSYRATHRPGRP